MKSKPSAPPTPKPVLKVAFELLEKLPNDERPGKGECRRGRRVEHPVRTAFRSDVEPAGLKRRLRLGGKRRRSEQRSTNNQPFHLVSPRVWCLCGGLRTTMWPNYSLARPAGNRAACSKPILVVFLQHLGGRPFFACVRETMNGAHSALFSLPDGAPTWPGTDVHARENFFRSFGWRSP